MSEPRPNVSLRDYAALAEAAIAIASIGDRETALAACVELLWPALQPTGVSWLGFYTDCPDQPDDRRMILGPHRDRPACSPIGMHGVCGQSLLAREPRVVRDVAELGPSYIACDPRDRSEVVVPLIDRDRICWAVLDLDSHDIGSFDAADAAGLTSVLVAAGLTHE